MHSTPYSISESPSARKLLTIHVDQIMSTIDAGMDDVTTKPYRIQDMLKQIARLLGKYDGDGGAEGVDAKISGVGRENVRKRGVKGEDEKEEDVRKRDSRIRSRDTSEAKPSKTNKPTRNGIT